jgi:hypothetical protein
MTRASPASPPGFDDNLRNRIIKGRPSACLLRCRFSKTGWAIALATATLGRRSACNMTAIQTAFLPVHHQISCCGSPCNKPLLRSVSVRWLIVTLADFVTRVYLPFTFANKGQSTASGYQDA